MEVVSVDAAGDGAGNSGGVGGGDLGAGIAERDVEVPQGGQRGENCPVRRHKLRRERTNRGGGETSLSEGDTRGKDGWRPPGVRMGEAWPESSRNSS